MKYAKNFNSNIINLQLSTSSFIPSASKDMAERIRLAVGIMGSCTLLPFHLHY